MPKVRMVIGGQYGSEGKGAFVWWLTDPERCGPVTVIRTGGPNAGHSVLHNGEHIKMQQLPCAWHNPQAALVLGPGSVIDLDILVKEIKMTEDAGFLVRKRLYIDLSATILEKHHGESERVLMRGIGSTGKGVGAATADRVMRRAEIADGIDFLRPMLRRTGELDWTDMPVVIESSQGFGLSLTRSYFYPFCTSRDITPAAVLNDAGVPHNADLEVIGVFRTFPIRVAGNSGPLYGELDWGQLAVRTRGYIQEPERTTVTNNVRRIGEWDPDLAREACRQIQPDSIYLSFFDYVRPDLAGRSRLLPSERDDLAQFQKDLSAPIKWVGTGFGSIVSLEE